MKSPKNLLLISKIFSAMALFLCAAPVWAAPTFTVSPSTVSNTYAGPITLQITNLATGDTVVVQKFLDANSNNIVDGLDLMVQQFNLTDGQAGQVIGNVTNFNVPGDLNSATGAITAMMNFQIGDVAQNIVGHYLYVLSSPAGHFTPLTKGFTVANFPYAQQFTGTVSSAGTTLSNAMIILFPAPRPGHHDLGQPLAGTMANSAGCYSIAMPAGTYTLVPFYTNFAANLQNRAVVALGSSSTVSTNLFMTNASASISGTVVDSTNTAIGLPGVFMPLLSTNNLLTSFFTTSNGAFNVSVTPSQWSMGIDDAGLIIHGYVGYNNGSNFNSGASGVIFPFPRANAMFYGSVKDNLGNPLVGIGIGDSDSNNIYSMHGYTDTNGNYFVGALGLGSSDPWQVGISSESSSFLTNYIVSQPQYSSTNLSADTAVQANFTAILATNIISGTVKDNLNNAITNVQVYANATIGGVDYQSQANTDGNGNYSLNVANGTWNLNVYCGGGQNSLPSNYACPNSITLDITNNNVITNLVVQQCSGVSISPVSPLPVGEVNFFYNQAIQASDCNGVYIWSQPGGSLPPGLSLFFSGSTDTLSGTPNASGVFSFNIQVSDGNGNLTNRAYSLTISNALQITTTTLPNGTNGLSYSKQLNATAGVPFNGGTPYTWSLLSGSLPANLNLATNGLLSGTTTVNGNFNFTVQAADAFGAVATQPLSLSIITTNLPPLSVGTAGGQVIVLWPSAAGTNFNLQMTTNLSTGPWVPATNGVPQNAFIFSNTAPAVFFRLQ